MNIDEVEDRLNVVKTPSSNKDSMFNEIMNYGGRVLDGAAIRFKGAVNDPGGTLGDIGLGALNSGPSTVSAIGDLLDVETPGFDSATKYLKSKLSDKSSLGFDMAEVVGVGGIIKKPALKIAKAMDTTSSNLAQASRLKEYIGKDLKTTDALKDAFSGEGKMYSNTLLDTEFPRDLTPTSRIVDIIKGGKNYDEPLGVFFPQMKKSGKNNIYVSSKENAVEYSIKKERYHKVKKDREFGDMLSTRVHEFDHDGWYRKYGSMSDSPVQRIKQTRGTKADLRKDAKWSSKPWEINAQAKQIQQELSILKKNGSDMEAYNRLEKLIQNTSPFVDDFVKHYPNELGDEILKGMDFLDNTRRMSGVF